MLSQKNKYLDKIYGVRKEHGKTIIDNMPIYFDSDHVTLNDEKYPKTRGLLKLLITKNPEQKYVS